MDVMDGINSLNKYYSRFTATLHLGFTFRGGQFRIVF